MLAWPSVSSKRSLATGAKPSTRTRHMSPRVVRLAKETHYAPKCLFETNVG